jgi:hypothetical protein
VSRALVHSLLRHLPLAQKTNSIHPPLPFLRRVELSITFSLSPSPLPKFSSCSSPFFRLSLLSLFYFSLKANVPSIFKTKLNPVIRYLKFDTLSKLASASRDLSRRRSCGDIPAALSKMPRPSLPPTPGSSVDIKGKDGPQFGQMSFELPPPALSTVDSRPSSASTKSSSTYSYHPASPKSAAVSPTNLQSAARRRSSAAQNNAKDVFTLPPPPTRSRKIIQMKPRGQQEQLLDMEGEVAKGPTAKAGPATSNKKKQPSATSVAGRKIARKTAHSLIERRRRSKMNEEFGVLKSMIPACTGEMHKLAILQVSILLPIVISECQQSRPPSTIFVILKTALRS